MFSWTGSLSVIEEFYKRGCQEKSSASTGVEICFSRSSPLSIGLAGAVLPFDSHKFNLIDSVAVLPFANIGGDPDTEYLSDGITESLINSLSRISKLLV